MTEIMLDATAWQSRDDLYAELLPALGAPSWHGHNLDALDESFRAGGILRVEYPLLIFIRNLDNIQPSIRGYLTKLASLITDLHDVNGINIKLEFL
jgi:RNAse (barnase) inhibitor barstar